MVSIESCRHVTSQYHAGLGIVRKISLALVLGPLAMTASFPSRADEQPAIVATMKTASTSVSQGDQLILRFKVSPMVDSQVVRLGNLIESGKLGHAR